MSHSYDFDFFVIGGGSGGVRAARIAASHGAKVGIAEGQYWGGTCVNVGCVPKKLFTYAADYHAAFEDARGYGWATDDSPFDWQRLIQNKNKEIERLNGIYRTMLDKAGVTLFEDFASFIDPHTMTVGGQKITADKILIAVGGTPRRPAYEGAEHTLTSDDMFFLDDLPKHIVIEGGGYIAVEFAHIFHGLGSKVTIIYRSAPLVQNFDSDIADFLTAEIEKQGITLKLNNEIVKVERSDPSQEKIVTLKSGDIIECDVILSAIGREPNTAVLHLSALSIQTNAKRQIVVNEDFQTSCESVYAVGDVTNSWQLTPVALAEGHILADRLFNKDKSRLMSYENIPTAVFSSPPVATVGMTEKQARESRHDIKIFKTSFIPMRHRLSKRDERTLMKLIVDCNNDKVLGAHMCGADAPEIMQGIAIALQCGATKADFDRTIGIHPTAAEEFVTMRGS